MNIGLLMLLLLCHWAADFTHLSTSEMLNAKRIGSPLFPIFKHALVHACLVLITIGFYPQNMNIVNILFIFLVFKCTLIELASHFLIDTLKGRLNIWFPSVANPKNKIHWYIFGLDQLAHIYIIILIVHIVS